MSLQSLMEEIESIEFAIRISVLSGFKILLLTLQHDETLAQLEQGMRKSPDNAHRISQRIKELVLINASSEDMHLRDEAITGYLHVLSRVEPERSRQAIQHILQTPNLFWARRLAEHLQESHSEQQKQPET